MTYSIRLITCENAKLVTRQVASVKGSVPVSALCRRLADVAFRKFGQDRVARNDGSLTGYYANRTTGDALVCVLTSEKS